MRPPRLLLPLLAISLALVAALVRPSTGRAGPNRSPIDPNPLVHFEPPRLRPPRGTVGHRPRRKLTSLRRARHTLAFGVRVADFAKHLLGVPYRYGGSSPATGFDCSGLVRYVYAHFGVSLSHSSFADFVSGRPVGRRQLRPGDLVFFDDAGHVGIYVGRARFIHAPHSGTVVRISTMRGWYGTRFTGARRIR